MYDLRARRGGAPLVIGHRGASGEAPENTLAAFSLALEQGADILEMDVQLTADGVPVVIHDPTVDRTTDGTGLVQSMTLDQVKRLDASAGFGSRYREERIPSLDEVLDWASGRVAIAVELKNAPVRNPGVEQAVVEALRRHGMVDHAVVISFDHHAVLRTKQICPEVAAGVLFAGSPLRPSALALDARAEVLLPHWSDVGPEMVRDAHERGLAIATWVVDTEPEMRQVLALDLDAIGTNFPGRLRSLLGPARPSA